MNTIELATAVSHIRQVVDEGRGPESFLFVVGAGISAPSIPLASDIERQCRLVAEERYHRTTPPPSDDPLDRYSHWFSQAYPQPRQRRDYLRSLIENKPITRANLRLGHLLLDGRLTRLVVTPNFDDLLSRGLRLLGSSPVVCDHPNTVTRIEIGSTDVQVVHVHGTYWFYDCCNLRPEIENRAEPSHATILTMSALLDNLFARRSPLVVGYSGWEGDVIMTALKKRLTAGVGTNLYWFCHARGDVSALPRWLVDHPSVCVVLPAQDEEAPNAGNAERRQAQQSVAGAEWTGLRAEDVFSALLQMVDAQVPPAISNPVAFLVRQLKEQVEQPDATSDSTDDSYGLASVIERTAAAARCYEEEIARSESIERVRDLLRRSLYREAIHSIDTLDLTGLTDRDLTDLASIAWDASYGLLDDSEDELLGYGLVVRLSDRREPAVTDLATRLRVARALLYQGITLNALGRSEEAIAAYDEAIRRYGEAEEEVLRAPVAMALANKGITLAELERSEEAIAAYDELIRRYGEAAEVVLREQVAKALVNKGVAVGQLGRRGEEIAAYDEAVHRFGEAAEEVLREHVAMALFNKGITLGVLRRLDDAVAAYDEVVHRFDEAPEAALRETVAKALVNKGVTLVALKRSEEAIALYDEVVRRFGDTAEAALREVVARALINKGDCLRVLDRRADAIAAYDEVLHRYAEAEEEALRAQVDEARAAGQALLQPESNEP